MNNEERINKILNVFKSSIEKHPDFDLTGKQGINTIYNYLLKLGVSTTDKDINLLQTISTSNPNNSIMGNLYYTFTNNSKVNVIPVKDFVHFVSTDVDTTKLSNHIKIYIPLDSKHIEEGTKQILDFMINNKIAFESKIAQEIRFDDFVVRLVMPEDAKKLLGFINSNQYIQDGLIKANPFAINTDNIAVISDGDASFNHVVSRIIAHYIAKRKEENKLDNISFKDLCNYLSNEYENYFNHSNNSDLATIKEREECKKKDIQEIIILLLYKDKLTFDTYLKIYEKFSDIPKDIDKTLKEKYLNSNSEDIYKELSSILNNKPTEETNHVLRFMIQRILNEKGINLEQYLEELNINNKKM